MLYKHSFNKTDLYPVKLKLELMTLDKVLMPRTSTDARDRILATADEMFYRYDPNAVFLVVTITA